MTRLSVNVNKVATLRNARGEGIPDVQKFATDCEALGAQGITVHPRPDERHITRRDVALLKPIITTEFNIEGYPSEEYLQLVLANKPTQATLVPDAADVLTTNEGWDVECHAEFLRGVVKRLKDDGIRVSIFVAADPRQIRAAAAVGADRVELYTKPYADAYDTDRDAAVAPFIVASQTAADCGLGVNAGHDLNSHNLRFFAESMPKLDEVSIGHAIISEALYDGIATVIKRYRDCLA
ncbi:pyridoxine 5'-phosphate synthase [Prevotella sp. CAG:485]|nr:pyridoxine 5'-phosphate synthase [Prevotella sp. CAG:485]